MAWRLYGIMRYDVSEIEIEPNLHAIQVGLIYAWGFQLHTSAHQISVSEAGYLSGVKLHISQACVRGCQVRVCVCVCVRARMLWLRGRCCGPIMSSIISPVSTAKSSRPWESCEKVSADIDKQINSDGGRLSG